MKRAPSDDLFRLIKSLKKGEKRNFKLLAGILAGDRDKKYLDLFDAIDKQEAYEESRLQRALGIEASSTFSSIKNYLYRFILKSLVHFDRGPQADLSSYRDQARILVAKDLPDQARKLLRKAVREAERAEQLEDLHMLLGFELDILLRTQHARKMGASIEALNTRKQEVLAQMANLDAYLHLSSKMSLLTATRHVARRPEDLQEFHEISGDPLLSDISMAKTGRAQLEFLTIHRKLSSYQDDIPRTIEYCQALITMFESQEQLLENHLHRYFAEIGYLCRYQWRSGAHDAAIRTLERLPELRARYPKARLDFFRLYYSIRIGLAVHVGHTEKGIALVDEIEREMKALEGAIPLGHEMVLQYLIAYMQLMHGDPGAALPWINRFRNSPRSEMRIDLQGFIRILNLLVHYDLGNYLVVESEIINTQRFLEKHGRLGAYETALLRAMRRLTHVAGGPKEAEAIAQIAADLAAVPAEHTRKLADDTLDFPLYIESKRTGRTMAEIRREKVGSDWRD